MRVLRYLWPLPYTLLGLALGLMAVILGAELQRLQGTFAFAGGQLPKLFKHLPGLKHFVAITFGHTILAESHASLTLFWTHEQVHVRQYERWGILFVPAYVFASVWVWLRGKHAYRDNPFEREAYAQEEGEHKRVIE